MQSHWEALRTIEPLGTVGLNSKSTQTQLTPRTKATLVRHGLRLLPAALKKCTADAHNPQIHTYLNALSLGDPSAPLRNAACRERRCSLGKDPQHKAPLLPTRKARGHKAEPSPQQGSQTATLGCLGYTIPDPICCITQDKKTVMQCSLNKSR